MIPGSMAERYRWSCPFGAGQKLWDPAGAPVTLADDDQRSIDIVSVGPGGLFVSWADSRSGSTDIYAHQAFSAGLIFGDGFEGGDTCEWDAAFP